MPETLFVMCRDCQGGHAPWAKDCPRCYGTGFRFADISASEVEGLREEVARLKHPVDSYACQRCGRATGLDAVVPNEVWARITGGRLTGAEVVGGKWNLLCLWCIDELCAEHGIKCGATLHFAGRAVCGTSQSDADAEHIARLAAEVGRLKAEVTALGLGLEGASGEAERLRAERDEYARTALEGLAGFVGTPEKGYVVDGGPAQLAADLREARRLAERLRAEVAALIDSRIGPWRGGGYAATLPWRSDGYPGGTWIHTGLCHFETRESAVAAVRAAAGLGPGGG